MKGDLYHDGTLRILLEPGDLYELEEEGRELTLELDDFWVQPALGALPIVRKVIIRAIPEYKARL